MKFGTFVVISMLVQLSFSCQVFSNCQLCTLSNCTWCGTLTSFACVTDNDHCPGNSSAVFPPSTSFLCPPLPPVPPPSHESHVSLYVWIGLGSLTVAFSGFGIVVVVRLRKSRANDEENQNDERGGHAGDEISGGHGGDEISGGHGGDEINGGNNDDRADNRGVDNRRVDNRGVDNRRVDNGGDAIRAGNMENEQDDDEGSEAWSDGEGEDLISFEIAPQLPPTPPTVEEIEAEVEASQQNQWESFEDSPIHVRIQPPRTCKRNA